MASSIVGKVLTNGLKLPRARLLMGRCQWHMGTREQLTSENPGLRGPPGRLEPRHQDSFLAPSPVSASTTQHSQSTPVRERVAAARAYGAFTPCVRQRACA